MRTNMRFGMATVVLAAGLVSQAMAVTVPYTPTDMADFSTGTTGNGGTWTNAFENTIWDGAGSSSSATVVDPGAAGQNFTIKTDFQVKTYYGGTLILGVSALADSASQGGDWSANKYYSALVRFDAAIGGSLDISTNNPSNYGSSLLGGLGQSVPWVKVNDAENTYLYTLTMNGVYDGSGNLTLSATLLDTGNAANTLTVSAPQIAAGDIGTGANFGLRDAAYYGGGVVQFSSFAITGVPEPTSLALIAVTAMGLMSRRRNLV